MKEKQRSKNYYDNDIKNSTNKILPLDSSLKIQEEEEKYNDLSNSYINNNNIETLKTKQKLSISLFNKMQNDPNISSKEKEKIPELIEQIRNKNYYYCLSDLNGANHELIKLMNQNTEIISKPQLVQLPNTIDYDIEFYKIGKKCSGIKKRFAIIKDRRLFSSSQPLNNLDKKKLKEKTKYLEGAEIINETIDNQSMDGGEWSNRNKKYRIRINYLEDKNKQLYSSFFMYFDNKKELEEVNLALFNISKKGNYKTIAKNSILNINEMLLNGKKFYTILKMLSFKNKIKKQKLNDINEKKSVNDYDKNYNINVDNPSIQINNHNLYNKQNINNINNDIQLQISDFMPLISNISSGNGNSKINIPQINELTIKLNSLKNIIPSNIMNNDEIELSDNGLCLGINEGVQVQNDFGVNSNFGLDVEKCRNARYIFIDKNKPEILFKEENDNNNYNENLNALNEDNIYEISNIIKNSSNNMHDKEENNLIILGPKIDNNKGINYKYNNNDTSFTDPENIKINIKRKIINSMNSKIEKVLIFQIYKKELDNQTIKNKLQIIFGDSSINDNSLNNLLFLYKIRLSPLKYIESPTKQSNSYKDDICLIEYNHQYYIPIEYLNVNQEIIIESYLMPLSYLSQQSNEFNLNKINSVNKLVPEMKIGYSIINLKNIKEKKIKYEIMDENGLPINNSYIYLDGKKDKIEGINIQNNVDGKDYSIGNDSYIITNINKDFINKVNNNNDIDEDLKKKYFNVHFDSINDNEFLFRPNENMDENDFKSDISTQISKKDLEKIIKNKKYSYLPYCEKFVDKETLYKSENLSCLSDNYKNYILNNFYPGQWIYKTPEIKVKLLSKNLGIMKNTNKIYQKLYCTGEEQIYPLESLIKFNDVNDRIIPISENNFNIFDFKEMHNVDFSNFQWKTSIKFNNALQMETFIKLLNLSRQTINTKKKSEKKIENNIMVFQEKNINELNKENEYRSSIISHEEIGDKCEIGIEYIEFINEFNLGNKTSNLEAKLIIEKPIENNENQNIKIIPFRKSFQINKNEFNNGKKQINFNEQINFIFNKNQINDITYKIIINLDNSEFYASLDIKKALNNTNCNILELPIYKKEEQNKIIDNIIYGLIEITISEIEQNSNIPFKSKYEEYNRKYLIEPLLIIKEESNLNPPTDFRPKNNHLGLYEPNIFRRKILNLIHNNNNLNIDINNLNKYDENELKKLYLILSKECVILPNISNFSYFQFSDLRRNNDINNMNNSYRKKIGLELLKIKRHNEFMKIFRENKWKLYLRQIHKSEEYKDPFEYFKNIPDKKLLFKNKNDMDNLQSLMYLGAPSKEYRQTIYSLLLDLPVFFNKTREIILRKNNEDLDSPKNIFNFFVNQLYEDDQEINLIFSLIDNDSNFISSIGNCSLEEINTIKKIAKAFFIWAELRIGLEDKNDKYVYFIGLLSLTQKLLKYFEESFFVFWILIGLAKNITHFHQKNPLFSDEMNYINIYGLVTKLIMERHQKKIYDKFISLNIPPELFISSHLSTFFTDYFKDELMMRIFDIIIFESSFQNIYSDNMQYLRILCSIPLTLFELNEDRILACKSVSEIESIINDLNLYTFNHNKFIAQLGNNINKFYVVSNFLEKYFNNNKGREWDFKRGEIENLIKRHFYPVFNENRIYLYNISTKLKANSQDIVDLYFNQIDNNLNSMRSFYIQGKAGINDINSIMSFGLQISKLRQIYNNQNCNIDSYKLVISFGNIAEQIDLKYKQAEFTIKFNTQNNEINNTNELFYKNQYPINQFPKYINFTLLDKNNNQRANFSYSIMNHELMKISKIVLENKEEINKYFLEFVLFKFTPGKISKDDLSLYNQIFSPPEYFHSKRIEEKLCSYYVSNNSFNKKIRELIKIQNNNRNNLVNGSGFDQNMLEIFKKMNNNNENEDDYNQKRIVINDNNKNIDNISSRLSKIIESCMQEDISTIVKNWLNNSKISLEEIFYGIILVDKSLVSINEKLHSLFSMGQLKDKFLFNIDDISVEKIKEMIYSLYKRFRIYFTKTDVERMVDFLLKDERLLNIKYVFVHNKKDIQKINEIIYDKDYYESNIDKGKKDFEIYFDDITKELIIYLNHLKNHYDLNIFSYEIISFILNSIIGQKDYKKYKEKNLDIITLVIEKDNIIHKRYYTINYLPSLKIEEIFEHPNFIKPKDENDILNQELCYEISNIYMNNSYNITKYINFNKFKEIFFKLPYLSDLFRVSFSYLNQSSKLSKKEFDSFKVIVGYEAFSHGVFYFPRQNYEDEMENDYENIIKYDMNDKIKISYTVDQIIKNIIKKISENNIRINNDEAVINDYLKSFNKIECYIWYEMDEYNPGRLIKEKIGYFDNLFSCTELKSKNKVELHIIFNNDIMTLNSNRKPVEKEDGYCKIYYSTNNDFIWKKCKVKRHNNTYSKLKSVDYKTTPRILNKNEDILLAYDI